MSVGGGKCTAAAVAGVDAWRMAYIGFCFWVVVFIFNSAFSAKKGVPLFFFLFVVVVAVCRCVIRSMGLARALGELVHLSKMQRRCCSDHVLSTRVFFQCYDGLSEVLGGSGASVKLMQDFGHTPPRHTASLDIFVDHLGLTASYLTVLSPDLTYRICNLALMSVPIALYMKIAVWTAAPLFRHHYESRAVRILRQ